MKLPQQIMGIAFRLLRIYEDKTMRLREAKASIKESMSTTVEVEDRAQLHKHIFDALGKKGFAVTDDMIHVTHYGYDDRVDWDEYIIVIDRFGVFGFTDQPCPGTGMNANCAAPQHAAEKLEPLFDSEITGAFAH
jgi:hypothetical protein